MSLPFAATLAALVIGAGAVAAGAPAAAADRTPPPVLVHSTPADGSWSQAMPSSARLTFGSDATAQAATLRVSTPKHPTAAPVRGAVSGRTVTVRVPDDGPGNYRVIWSAVPRTADDDGAGAGAGTVRFRVGGTSPDSGLDAATGDGLRAFTIGPAPARPEHDPDGAPSGHDEDTEPDGGDPDTSGPDAEPDDPEPDSAEPDSAQPDGAQPDGAQPDGAQPDGAQPDGAEQANAGRTARAMPAGLPRTPPAPPGATRGPLGLPTGPALLATLIVGAAAFAAGAFWSVRVGNAAAGRPL